MLSARKRNKPHGNYSRALKFAAKHNLDASELMGETVHHHRHFEPKDFDPSRPSSVPLPPHSRRLKGDSAAELLRRFPPTKETWRPLTERQQTRARLLRKRDVMKAQTMHRLPPATERTHHTFLQNMPVRSNNYNRTAPAVPGRKKARPGSAESGEVFPNEKDVRDPPDFGSRSNSPEGPREPPLNKPFGGQDIRMVSKYYEPEALQVLTEGYREWVVLVATMARRIFHIKCKDINVMPTQQREARFIASVLKFCRCGRFVLKDQALGPRSAKEITYFLTQNTSSCVSTSFSFVDLSGNELGDEGALHIAQLLVLNNTITHLSLRSNEMTGFGFACLFEAIAGDRHSNLKKLDLGSPVGAAMYIGAGTEGPMALKQMLATSSVLQELSISNCGLGVVPGAVSYLAEGLECNHTLHTLDLSHNNMGPDAAKRLRKAAEENGKLNLVNLLLAGNQVSSIGAMHMAHVIRNCKSLVKLDLTKNGILAAGWTLLSHACHHAHLKELILDGNDLSAKSNQWLTLERRTTAPKEDVIDLMRDIDRQHLRGKYVSPRLADAPLSVLSLNNCSLRDHFVVPFCDTVKHMSHLKTLNFARNFIKYDGTTAIGTMLQQSQSIKRLDLSYNGLDDEGVNRIVKGISQNSSLTELCLKSNEISSGSVETLGAALEANPNLIMMPLLDNKLSFKEYTKLKVLVDSNKAVFDAALPERQQAVIAELQLDEAKLWETQALIKECQKDQKLENMHLRRAELQVKKHLRAENDQTDALEEKHKECSVERLALEHGLQDISRKIRQTKKQRDAENATLKVALNEEKYKINAMKKQLAEAIAQLPPKRDDESIPFEKIGEQISYLMTMLKEAKAKHDREHTKSKKSKKKK